MNDSCVIFESSETCFTSFFPQDSSKKIKIKEAKSKIIEFLIFKFFIFEPEYLSIPYNHHSSVILGYPLDSFSHPPLAKGD
jgi:hypothetical protein